MSQTTKSDDVDLVPDKKDVVEELSTEVESQPISNVALMASPRGKRLVVNEEDCYLIQRASRVILVH